MLEALFVKNDASFIYRNPQSPLFTFLLFYPFTFIPPFLPFYFFTFLPLFQCFGIAKDTKRGNNVINFVEQSY